MCASGQRPFIPKLNDQIWDIFCGARYEGKFLPFLLNAEIYLPTYIHVGLQVYTYMYVLCICTIKFKSTRMV